MQFRLHAVHGQAKAEDQMTRDSGHSRQPCHKQTRLSMMTPIPTMLSSVYMGVGPGLLGCINSPEVRHAAAMYVETMHS